MTPTDLFDNLARRTADAISDIVTAKVEAFMTRFCKAQVKFVYSESEAAELLKVSRPTLAAWRKRGIISYCQYPAVRSDELGEIYTYSLPDILNFREKYLIKAPSSGNVFEINPAVSVVGPEVRRAA